MTNATVNTIELFDHRNILLLLSWGRIKEALSNAEVLYFHTG